MIETTTPIECAYLPPDATGAIARPGMSPGDTTAWIDRHGCHELATWAVVTPGLPTPNAVTYACAAHLAELCEDWDIVRRLDTAGAVLR